MVKNKSENFLDLIPVRCSKFPWETEENEIVVFFIENKGLFNRLAQRFLNKPKISRLCLDEIGSFVWLQIDGESSVYEIAGKLQERFDDKIEPLYDRLTTYVYTLKKYNLIDWK